MVPSKISINYVRSSYLSFYHFLGRMTLFFTDVFNVELLSGPSIFYMFLRC